MNGAFPLERLVSHPLCPHLQRTVLTAIVAGWSRARIPVEYVALGERPEWTIAYAPRGERPFFVGPRGMTWFDSRAVAGLICELAGIAPADAISRAQDQDAVARVDLALSALRSVFTASSRDALERALPACGASLAACSEVAKIDVRSAFGCAAAPIGWLLAPFPSFAAAIDDRVGKELIEALRTLADDPRVAAAAHPERAVAFASFFARTHSVFPEHFVPT